MAAPVVVLGGALGTATATATPGDIAEGLGSAAGTEGLDPLMQQIKTHTPLVAALYFNSWDSLNHIYPWFLTPDQYPHARDIGRRTVSLPISAKLTDEDVTDVIQAVRGILAK